MTVRDILNITPAYMDVSIFHKDKPIALLSKTSNLLELDDFIMTRRVEKIEIDGQGPISRWIIITLAAEENE